MASWVLPTPPMPCTDTTVTVDPAARAVARSPSSRPRPVKFGLCAGTFHARGSPPGKQGWSGTARAAPGNCGQPAVTDGELTVTNLCREAYAGQIQVLALANGELRRDNQRLRDQIEREHGVRQLRTHGRPGDE